MQEGRREKHVRIDLQTVALRQLERDAVVALRMLPAPRRMVELRDRQIVDRHLPGRVERNPGRRVRRLHDREQRGENGAQS